METVFKGPKCEVEFQRDHSEPDGEGYVCYDCLMIVDSFDRNSYQPDTLSAIKHLQDHVRAGHLIPPSLIFSLQQDLVWQTLVHQSAMSPLRRHDGSLSGHREKAFHDEWHKEQVDRNSAPLLHLMLRGVNMAPITQRDATIAATLIQWLGTNVGFCFLESALKWCGYKIVKDEKHASK